jgi:hypothetical protein
MTLPKQTLGSLPERAARRWGTREALYFQGRRWKDFGKTWGTARKRAGSPASLRHDFRRGAVRDIVKDGTPEKVAMMMTGHKTRSVFDRYHIAAPEDLKAATACMAARAGHGSGHGSGMPDDGVR